MVFVSFSFTMDETKVGHIEATYNILKDVLKGALNATKFGMSVAANYETYKEALQDD